LWLNGSKKTTRKSVLCLSPIPQKGDHILFGKYSGSDIKLDGTEYLIMREDEVLAVLEGGTKKAKA
jgi:chaperonin GroES